MSIATVSHTRSRILLVIGIAAFGLLVLLAAASADAPSSQASTVNEIGLGDYQFVGRADQDGAQFISYGYVYGVQEVPSSDLFSDPLHPSEATAYLTYYATATLTARAVITDAMRSIFALNTAGQMTYYHQATPSASFDDPQSFAQGTAVTTATVRLQDILTVTAPNRGRAVGNGVATVVAAQDFTLGGQTVRFGRVHQSHEISTHGDAIRTEPTIPQASVLLAGYAASRSFWQQLLFPYVTRSGALE